MVIFSPFGYTIDKHNYAYVLVSIINLKGHLAYYDL